MTEEPTQDPTEDTAPLDEDQIAAIESGKERSGDELELAVCGVTDEDPGLGEGT